MKKLYYAGIGSRKTPRAILQSMTEIARELNELGFILRSGGAGGADTAFEQGAGEKKEIFIPWNGFNGRKINDLQIVIPIFNFKMASEYHPAWDRCSPAVKKLHARNCNQVLGRNPGRTKASECIICWTPGGEDVGGTGQAIRIARYNEIRVFNLAVDSKDLIMNIISTSIK